MNLALVVVEKNTKNVMGNSKILSLQQYNNTLFNYEFLITNYELKTINKYLNFRNNGNLY